MAQSPKQRRGAAAEQAALVYLEEAGLTLLARNFRTRFGELDLVMRCPSNMVAFIEVRLRIRQEFGGGLASVTYAKQRRLIRAAEIFLNRHHLAQQTLCRFDVVSVSKRNYAWTFDWVRDAFALD